MRARELTTHHSPCPDARTPRLTKGAGSHVTGSATPRRDALPLHAFALAFTKAVSASTSCPDARTPRPVSSPLQTVPAGPSCRHGAPDAGMRIAPARSCVPLAPSKPLWSPRAAYRTAVGRSRDAAFVAAAYARTATACRSVQLRKGRPALTTAFLTQPVPGNRRATTWGGRERKPARCHGARWCSRIAQKYARFPVSATRRSPASRIGADRHDKC